MFKDLLETLEALENQLESEPDAITDAESVIRIELAEILDRAGVLLRALTADETERGKS